VLAAAERCEFAVLGEIVSSFGPFGTTILIFYTGKCIVKESKSQVPVGASSARARNAFVVIAELSATKRWTADLLGDLLRLAQIHHPMSSLRHALIMCRYLCKSRAGRFVGI
jgi:hypothetical protein